MYIQNCNRGAKKNNTCNKCFPKTNKNIKYNNSELLCYYCIQECENTITL